MDMRLRNIAEASLAQKPLNGLFRRRNRWPLDVLVHVLGTYRQATNIERQTRGVQYAVAAS